MLPSGYFSTVSMITVFSLSLLGEVKNLKLKLACERKVKKIIKTLTLKLKLRRLCVSQWTIVRCLVLDDDNERCHCFKRHCMKTHNMQIKAVYGRRRFTHLTLALCSCRICTQMCVSFVFVCICFAHAKYYARKRLIFISQRQILLF